MSRHLSSLFDRAWWIPFAFVALAVSALLFTPLLVNRSMLNLRVVIDEATSVLVLLNDL